MRAFHQLQPSNINTIRERLALIALFSILEKCLLLNKKHKKIPSVRNLRNHGVYFLKK
jgi:hypothetical protein